MKLEEVKKIIDKVQEELRGYLDDLEYNKFTHAEIKSHLTEDALNPLTTACDGLDEILYVLEDLI